MVISMLYFDTLKFTEDRKPENFSCLLRNTKGQCVNKKDEQSL